MPEAGSEARVSAAPGRRTFVVNALTSYGKTALYALSALLLTPYLFRTLGTGGFGTWSVMLTLTTVFTMLEAGFAVGTTKFVAEHRAVGQRRELETTVGISLLLNLAFGLLTLLVCVGFAAFASGLAADGDREAFEDGMVILGAAFLVRFPLATYGAVLAGYQRYDLFNLAAVVDTVLPAIAAVVIVEMGGGVLGVAIAFAAGFVAGGICCFILMKRLDPGLRLRPRVSDRSALRRVLGFSSLSLLGESMNLVAVRMDTVVIAALRNAAAAAPFAAAIKLQSGLQSFTLPVINLMVPMISDLEARGMREAVVRRLVVGTRVTLQVTLPLALVVALFSTDIVDLWLGPSAPAVTAAIVTVLALQTTTLCEVPSQKVLLGMGHARAVGLLNTAWAITNLAISVALVTAYGAIGAALGTLISTLLIGPANFPLACRATGCPLTRLLGEGLWPAIASSLPSIVAMALVWLLLPPSLGRLALGLVVGVSAAALVGLLQIGPRRTLSEIRSGLGVKPEAGPPLVAEGGP
jgi:O-antigen/teichoic acid export membrane protein